jgi:hypothetical protein
MKESKQSLPTLKKTFQNNISELLETKGFKSKKDRLIEYDNNGIKQSIHLAFVDNRPENFTSLIVNLAVRIDQVEEIATTCSWADDLTTKEKKDMATLGVQIGKLLGKGQLRWNIHNNAECETVAEDVFILLKEVGIPYLAEHSDMNAILKRFESDSFKEWHALLDSRAIRLPIILILLHKTEDAKVEFTRQYKLLLDSDAYLAPAYPKFVSEVCDRMNITNPMEELDE